VLLVAQGHTRSWVAWMQVAHASGSLSAVASYLFGSSSMIPRFNPIVTAWVRSFAPSLRRMLLTRLLTVSSEIES
jgi:hypothetical protein